MGDGLRSDHRRCLNVRSLGLRRQSGWQAEVIHPILRPECIRTSSKSGVRLFDVVARPCRYERVRRACSGALVSSEMYPPPICVPCAYCSRSFAGILLRIWLGIPVADRVHSASHNASPSPVHPRFACSSYDVGIGFYLAHLRHFHPSDSAICSSFSGSLCSVLRFPSRYVFSHIAASVDGDGLPVLFFPCREPFCG